MNHIALSDICYQLSVVFKSGLPISDGIKILSEDSDDREIAHALENICHSLDQGLTISEAFESSKLFPRYMCEMVKVGENAGKLPTVFDELHAYYLGRAEFQKKLRNAISYPLALLFMMFAVLGLLIFKVLPVFHSLLISLGGEIPAASAAIFRVADTMKSALVIVVGLVAVLIVFSLLVFKFRVFPKLRSTLLMRLPLVSKIYKKNLLVKLSRALTTLIASGYSFEMASEKALPLIEDDVIKNRIDTAVSEMVEGTDVYDSLRKIQIFPNLFFKMFKLGAKTGTLDEMAAKFTDTYQRELDNMMDKTASMVEPILVTVMSVVVGIVLLMTLLPLIGIISAIG
ncbi:MAG: type II secretion system F family protein [Bacillota bacterium]|nr:type II secretion system F family protein [Bacillota bacterium]